MKRLANAWSSFPAEHRKRFYQGLGCYALLCGVAAVWVSLHARSTIEDWQSRTPSATASIQTIYQAPQPAEKPPDVPLPEKAVSVVPAVPATPAVPAFEHSDRTIPLQAGGTYIAVIVSDLGLSAPITERAMNDLPANISLAFSPYADNVNIWIKKSIHAGHEALMLMPMETVNYPQNDPGPRALSSRLSDEDNKDNLDWLLKQGSGTVGVVNFMGSRFLSDKKRLLPVFTALQKNGAIFVETPEQEKSQAAGVAEQTSLPYLVANLRIDGTLTEVGIQTQLAALEKIAHERGYAVGMASNYPLTFTALKTWAAGLEARGITLAPLSVVWKNKPHHEETPPPLPAQPPKP